MGEKTCLGMTRDRVDDGACNREYFISIKFLRGGVTHHDGTRDIIQSAIKGCENQLSVPRVEC